MLGLMTSPSMNLPSQWLMGNTMWCASHAVVAMPPSKWTTSQSLSATQQVGHQINSGGKWLYDKVVHKNTPILM